MSVTKRGISVAVLETSNWVGNRQAERGGFVKAGLQLTLQRQNGEQ